MGITGTGGANTVHFTDSHPYNDSRLPPSLRQDGIKRVWADDSVFIRKLVCMGNTCLSYANSKCTISYYSIQVPKQAELRSILQINDISDRNVCGKTSLYGTVLSAQLRNDSSSIRNWMIKLATIIMNHSKFYQNKKPRRMIDRSHLDLQSTDQLSQFRAS